MNTPLLLRRAAAFGLDCLLLFVTLGPLTFILQYAFIDGTPTGPQLWVCLLFGFSIPAWTYFSVSDHSRSGATVGKRVLGIRVTTEGGDQLSVSRATLLRAQSELLGCEACSEEADRPFTWTLDRVSGQDPSVTDYLLSEPAKCPRCQGPVFEETLVEDWG